MHSGGATQGTAALGAFGLQQMPLAGAGAQDFSAGRNLEPLGHGLLGFDAFRTSHKSIDFLSKRARNIDNRRAASKRYFGFFGDEIRKSIDGAYLSLPLMERRGRLTKWLQLTFLPT